jgi:hypothetical protein
MDEAAGDAFGDTPPPQAMEWGYDDDGDKPAAAAASSAADGKR